ncbi:hypothetical protein [Sphaerisporangium aureirubrum]|uniref:hypothetical protein n=1 Tax=Sphaerisporangium aureirubrum TaxID=1544736 RepID=UPI0036D427D3
MAAERALGDEDAERAYEHAKVARRFAARIGVVREAVGVAAYHAGHYAEALSDLRAARRLTGSDAYLPVMADCERGLGRPERALDLVRSPEAAKLDREGRVELAIVESGARRDLGQHDAAVITLQRLAELRDQTPHPWSARLTFAYADALAEAGHEDAATEWFERAMTFDEDGETDAAERYAELTGSVIEDLEDDEDEDGDLAPAAPTDQDADDADDDTEADVDDDDEPEASAEATEQPADDEAGTAGGVVEILEVAEIDEIADEPQADAPEDVVTAEPIIAEPVTADLVTAENDDEDAETGGSVIDEPAAGPDIDEPVAGPGGMVPAFIEPNFGVPAVGYDPEAADDADENDAKDDKPGEHGSGQGDGEIGSDKRTS